MSKPCCGPDRSDVPHAVDSDWLTTALAIPPANDATRAELAGALIPLTGGFFDMGIRQDQFIDDFCAPRRKVKLSPFRISATACSNAEYARFVHATGYLTVAEREGWSSVFMGFLDQPEKFPRSPPGLPWWRLVEGACWSAPEGAGSTISGREDHPVVHVSWFDALAYCTWAGLHLPTEAQWEFAARGGLARAKFPWGDEMQPGGTHMMNTWQGRFPIENTAEDGFAGTAPVRAFAPNGYGLFNTCGNVWEWVQDYYLPGPIKGPFPLRDPKGPLNGDSRVQRGGSHLCHESYCNRYHVHSRTRNTPDSSTGHTGFRVAAMPKADWTG